MVNYVADKWTDFPKIEHQFNNNAKLVDNNFSSHSVIANSHKYITYPKQPVKLKKPSLPQLTTTYLIKIHLQQEHNHKYNCKRPWHNK